MVYHVQARNVAEYWHTVGSYYNQRTAIEVAVDTSQQVHFCQVVDRDGEIIWKAAPRAYEEPSVDEQDRVFAEHYWPELAD
jgi:hypothetical protein